MNERMHEQHLGAHPLEVNPQLGELSERISSGQIHSQDGPFLWTIIRDCRSQKDKSTPSYPIQSELDEVKVQLAQGCASFLKDIQWHSLTSDTKLRQLIEPVSNNGHKVYNIATRIFSDLLRGMHPDAVTDMTRHRGHPIPSQVIIDIHRELSPFLAQKHRHRLEALTDDDFPYLDLHTVPEDTIKEYVQKLLASLSGKFATYGGINLDVFFELTSRIHDIAANEKAEVCPELDDILGLRMPEVWYFNTGGPPSPFALFFNSVQSRGFTKNTSRNAQFREEYGIVALVEGYDTKHLTEFAHSNGYISFSTPFDLVNTAGYIVSGKALASVRDNPEFYRFADGILDYWSKKTGNSVELIIQTIRSIDPQEATNLTLTLLRSFWEEILIPRGVVTTDEEMIILDPNANQEHASTLLYCRRPDFVLMGGNIDGFYPKNPYTNVTANNMALANAQYPQSKIITPYYISPDHTSLWPAKLTQEPGYLWTTDGLLVSLIALRELGRSTDYHNLRAMYHRLADWMDSPRKVRRDM